MKRVKFNPASIVIKKMRIEAGFSIRKLAAQIGVSHAAISQWEKESEKLPYFRAIEIAQACGYDEKSFDLMVGQYSQSVDYLSESQKLLEGLDSKRLKALHSLLLHLNFYEN